ncbi:hypothetical protein IHE55_19450 [Streptomyces pactum]|uniref:Uncharacterized protein n=1 Tax=Streptomyces pactum TaxID=68249 RepID=A0ABS0NNS6_9ACTN|nr:hypothetical protein [Streptomyces pactum]MBH5336826.1 hypothetical protein [Streptomyces pactum]
MGQGRTLTRQARVVGAVLCAALALLSSAWIIRDLGEADEPGDLWWTWAGLPYRTSTVLFGSALADLVLVVLALFAAGAALRTPSAAGALGSLGLIAVALRLPLLWTVDDDWGERLGAADGLLTRATLSGWAAVALGTALLLTAVVGGRPAAPPGGYEVPPADRAPAVPGPGVAAAGALVLAATGVVLAAWQFYWAQELEWERYEALITGEGLFITLLATPPAWSAWAAVLLALAAAVATARRAAYARPLGMMTGALVLLDGISGTAVYFKVEYIEHFDELPTTETLGVLTSFFEVLAGFLALVLLAQRGVPHPGYGPPGGYGRPVGAGGYGTGSGGYGDTAGGYGDGPGGYGTPASGGYGHGPGGHGYGTGPGGHGYGNGPGGYGGGHGTPAGYGYGDDAGPPGGGPGSAHPPEPPVPPRPPDPPPSGW